MRTEDEVDPGAGPLDRIRLAVAPLVHAFRGRPPPASTCSFRAGLEEVVRQSPRRLGEDAVLGAAGVCAEDAQAAKKYRHLRPEDEASRAMIGSRVSDW